jgi:hypothetical protein
MYSKKGLNVMGQSQHFTLSFQEKQITHSSFWYYQIGNLLVNQEGENIGTVVNI